MSGKARWIYAQRFPRSIRYADTRANQCGKFNRLIKGYEIRSNDMNICQKMSRSKAGNIHCNSGIRHCFFHPIPYSRDLSALVLLIFIKNLSLSPLSSKLIYI